MPKKDIITMAKIVHEKREFINNQTGQKIEYEVFGISSYVDGELTELQLKNLSQAEKIAWKMVMSGSDLPFEQVTRKATSEEIEQSQKNVKITPSEEKLDLDSDNELEDDWLND